MKLRKAKKTRSKKTTAKPIRVPWDKYETALLIDSYLKVKAGEQSKGSAARELSCLLRQRASERGIAIDEVFRNENGVKMQFENIRQVLEETPGARRHNSSVFVETVDLYNNNNAEFQLILQKAKGEIVASESKRMPDRSLGSDDPILEYLDMEHLEYIDLREKSGCLWILGNQDIAEQMKVLGENGIDVRFKPGGGNATNGRDAWWTKSTRESGSAIRKEKPHSEKSTYEIDASETAYYNWLSQHELLSGPTCRVYVSGVRSSERFAKEHNYAFSSIFVDDDRLAGKTIHTLLEDAEFLEKHSSYRSHLKKYLQFIGEDVDDYVDLPVVKPSEQNASSNELSEYISKIESIVRSYPEGISAEDISKKLGALSDRQFRNALNAADIICVMNRYYHKDNIEDFALMADILLEALNRQFKQYGGYTSANQLYKETQPKLDDFFFYNSAFDSKLEVYELAAYLFDKAHYKNNRFIFKDKRHIWEERPDYPMDFSGILVNYARNHKGVFTRDEAVDFLSLHGSETPSQTLSLILHRSGKRLFLQYAENQFVISEAICIDDSFLKQLVSRIEVLLDGEDYVAMGDISDYFYATLPQLPDDVTWGPLLLESILSCYDIGFATIDAGESNDMKTIDAALIRKNSRFQGFSDVVWNELSKDYQLPIIMSNDEFRLYLLKKGFIHGMEKVNSVHKTVAKDLRFFWTDGNKNVTISK